MIGKTRRIASELGRRSENVLRVEYLPLTFSGFYSDYSVSNDTSESRFSNGDVSIQFADGFAV